MESLVENFCSVVAKFHACTCSSMRINLPALLLFSSLDHLNFSRRVLGLRAVEARDLTRSIQKYVVESAVIGRI